MSLITKDTVDILKISSIMENKNSLYFGPSLSNEPFWLIESYEILMSERNLLIKNNE